MEDMRYLTFALGKGRLANQTLETFEKIGITCEEMKDKKTRKLIFVNEEYKLRFFLAKGPGCSNLCGIRCCRHWNCRKRHDLRRRTQYLRSLRLRLWKMQNVCLWAKRSRRTVKAQRTDPRGNQISEDRKGLFLQ